jgi:flagellar biosynthesis/type III secretory pathway protein FliH
MYSDRDEKSPFTVWWNENMQQIACSPDIREMLARAFEGGQEASLEYNEAYQMGHAEGWEMGIKEAQEAAAKACEVLAEEMDRTGGYCRSPMVAVPQNGCDDCAEKIRGLYAFKKRYA